MSFDQDFADARNIERLARRSVWEFHPLDAGDGPTIDAYKMRVAAPIVLWVPNFKSPNMIPKLGSTDEVRFRQVGKISKNRRLVKAHGDQLIG